MFLQMRRDAVRRGGGDYAEHCVILNYERRGTSRRYTYYGLPRDCDTIFFPGCALSGTRPDKVEKLFEHLRKSSPSLGIVLDCCTKPSHDLGREDHFRAMFHEMAAYLLENGVRRVLVACPNCYEVFKEYGGDLAVRTVYEVLAENGMPKARPMDEVVTIHDPCVVRFDGAVHSAVRELAGGLGLAVEEMAHRGEKTLCCGEGGSVRFLLPELARRWCAGRNGEAGGRRIITYCAGCADMLSAGAPTDHILDLLFHGSPPDGESPKVSKAPVTYWNRLRLKHRFKKSVDVAVARERDFAPETGNGKGSVMRCLRRFFRMLASSVGRPG